MPHPMQWIFDPLNEIENYRKLKEAARQDGVFAVYGVDDSQRLHLLAGLALELNQPLLFITATDQAAQRAYDDLNSLLNGRVALLPGREISFQRVDAESTDLAARRVAALGAASRGSLRALVATAEALLYPLMPRKRFDEAVFELREGDEMDPEALMNRLVNAGYERVSRVEARGQCTLRGGIVDVFPVGLPNAIRAEFFGDEIDSLREFDPFTQRSVARIARATVFPASETPLSPEEAEAAARRIEEALGAAASAPAAEKRADIPEDLPPWDDLFEDELPSLEELEKKPDTPAAPEMSALQRNFLPRAEALRADLRCAGADALMPFLYTSRDTVMDYLRRPLVALDQPEKLRNHATDRLLDFEEQYKTALERDMALPQQGKLLFQWDDILSRLTEGTAISLTPFARSQNELKLKGVFGFEGMNAASYQGNLHELARTLKENQRQKYRTAILAGGSARAERLKKSLDDQGLSAAIAPEEVEALESGKILIFARGLGKGFIYPAQKFSVFSETDVYGAGKQKNRTRWQAGGEKLEAFTDLKVGDYVVHEQYGIGQFMGVVRLQADGSYGDYLHIRYNGADKLYVPTDQLDRVQKYIGSDGETPKVNKLSGTEWQKQKARVKAGIEEIAGDLVKLYAKRQAAPGYAFPPDTPWQRELEDSFEYDETEDQLTAVTEIKRDMERPQVMDRLLCGDVGYGKTEVALRAIFKAVMSGKQAALLAPTTILVQQHYNTILRRFAHFPVRVDYLSRFRTPSEIKRAVENLKSGAIDVVVGTHRLLGSDVGYKDLGLLVVDEEQRFGVQHKEKIKKLKENVDVLTLSATPIPRTLHMSMVGIRDMSLLRTPPEERYPVQTYVLEYSDGLVRDALLREIARGGQAYVLYNKVQSIEKFYERLRRLVPEARIAIGHGQMREHMLEDVMMDFYDGKFDVLLCTTIVESGLDVPTANTLIVIDADHFGLAQLYQLRGRVGRSNRLAYAYLTTQPRKVLTENAEKRLAAIREFTEFGSGFRVAMRDLEIRGAGNLLGQAQSGHMASVGYDLYVKMIEETVRSLRGEELPQDIQTRVELRLDAYLPGDYVPGSENRLAVYKRIAQVGSRSDRDDLVDELIDRFGDPPKPVMNLVEIAYMKSMCHRLGADTLGVKAGQLWVHMSPLARLDPQKLLSALMRNGKYLTLAAGNPPSILYKNGNRSQEELLRLAIPVFEDVVGEVCPDA